jgi:hypothetical protein
LQVRANSVRDGKKMAGACAIGNRAAEACFDVVDMSKGDKFVSMTLPVTDSYLAVSALSLSLLVTSRK